MAIEAFVLTGQGSQFVGMGRILLDNSITERTAAQTYRDGSRISGVDVRALCTTGSKEDLLATANTQLAVAVTDIILLRVYIDVVKITPDVVAGHSLGQIPAFHAVGALTFEQTVELTKERGRAMEEAGRRHPGMMAAVKNLEREDIERICEEAHIKIANYNLGQVVISGSKEGVALALTKIKESGGAAIPLDVSIASHSSLMQEAEDQMRSYVGGVEVADPHKPVILNTTAKPAKNAQEISNEIPSALTSSVRWDETIRYMREAEGATVFREVGPGEVLANMLRKNRDSIRGEIEVYSSKDLIPDFHR